MSYIEYAEAELRRAGLFDRDADYDGMIAVAVMELVRCHARQGHSGGSHHITLEVFNKVINFKPLTPLTADPDEWTDVSHHSNGPTWQSKRCPSAFSNDGGKTWWDLDAVKPLSWWRRILRWLRASSK